MELFDQGLAVLGFASEFEVEDIEGLQVLFDEGEHGGELGEDEGAVLFGEELFEEAGEVVKFGGAGWRFRVEEAGVAADLAQFEEGIEEHHLVVVAGAFGDGLADLFVHH